MCNGQNDRRPARAWWGVHLGYPEVCTEVRTASQVPIFMLAGKWQLVLAESLAALAAVLLVLVLRHVLRRQPWLVESMQWLGVKVPRFVFRAASRPRMPAPPPEGQPKS